MIKDNAVILIFFAVLYISKFVLNKAVIPPCFKFGMNPPLIDGILNVLPYELKKNFYKEIGTLY